MLQVRHSTEDSFACQVDDMRKTSANIIKLAVDIESNRTETRTEFVV